MLLPNVDCEVALVVDVEFAGLVEADVVTGGAGVGSGVVQPARASATAAGTDTATASRLVARSLTR